MFQTWDHVWRCSVASYWTVYLTSDVRVCSFLQQKSNHLHAALIRSPHKSGPAALQPHTHTHRYFKCPYWSHWVVFLNSWVRVLLRLQAYLRLSRVIISSAKPAHWHHDTLFQTLWQEMINMHNTLVKPMRSVERSCWSKTRQEKSVRYTTDMDRV